MGSMGPGTGFGLGMGGGWWLVLLFALLVTGVVAAVLYLQTRDVDDNPQDCALAVLSERYAAGDLDDEEFERRRERLVG
jgi:putative membrane protein